MAEATGDIGITLDDVNGLIQESPMVSLQLQNRALVRKCQELVTQVQALQEEIATLTSDKGVSNANGKKGR
jgi:hypothetical protein